MADDVLRYEGGKIGCRGRLNDGGVVVSMLLRRCTLVLLVLAGLLVNTASVADVIVASEEARSPAVNVTAVYHLSAICGDNAQQSGDPWGSPEPPGGGAKNLPPAYRERARDLSALRRGNTQQPWDN